MSLERTDGCFCFDLDLDFCGEFDVDVDDRGLEAALDDDSDWSAGFEFSVVRRIFIISFFRN